MQGSKKEELAQATFWHARVSDISMRVFARHAFQARLEASKELRKTTGVDVPPMDIHVTPTEEFIGEAGVERIIQIAAATFNVRVEDIKGRSRSPSITRIRFAAIALARKKTACSTVEIGRVLNKDHSSILYALDATHDNRAKYERELTLLERILG